MNFKAAEKSGFEFAKVVGSAAFIKTSLSARSTELFNCLTFKKIKILCTFPL
jgi:hypothetical protein